MIGKAEMMMVIGSTENSQNLDFLTTSFDLANELHREDSYYSLLLLFTPFRDESSLLEHETAEAFHRLVNADSSTHHFKLQNMLKAQSNIKTINEARQADGEEEKVSKHNDDPQLAVFGK